MFNDLPPLTSLRALESAVRLGAFNLAAEELNVTPAAIGAQVRSLEAWLGVALFERRNRRVVPTVYARHLQQACKNGFSVIQDAIASSAAENASLTVGVGSLFASRWLSPRLSDFWLAHPEISLRLVHSPVIQSSLPKEFDAAVVWGTGDWPGVFTHRLFRPKLLPVASPAYLSIHGRPETLEDLSTHALIQEQGDSLWRAWFDAAGHEIADHLLGTAAGDGTVAMQLALDGQGICIGVEEFMENDLNEGRLVALFDPVTVGEFAYYLVLRDRDQTKDAARRFAEWITGAGDA